VIFNKDMLRYIYLL